MIGDPSIELVLRKPPSVEAVEPVHYASYEASVGELRNLLDQLPVEIRRRVAWDNAEGLLGRRKRGP